MPKHAVITVVGRDRVGIVAGISSLLAENEVNIIDISQTVLRGMFAMIMIVDLSRAKVSVGELREALKKKGKELGVDVALHSAELVETMERI
ncbi:MAG: ACT domain-containing protein [Crenarchaeota archaeon]|nr:ACT domain-containing protein [Thermoproteota archaeon]